SFRGGDLRQDCVERARSVTINVNGDETETNFPELAAKAIEHIDLQSFGHFFPGDLNTRNVPMMPHARLAETESRHHLFALVDHAQLLARDRGTIRNS